MKIRLLTPTSNEVHDAEAVFLPGAAGSFEVLKGHAPLISTLSAGELRWREGGEERSMSISSGVVRVLNDEILVCVER